MKKQTLILVLAIAIAVGFILWKQYPTQQAAALANNGVVVAKTNEPIEPLPLSMDLDERKVRLGDKLFHDPRLSHDNTISCSSCHSLSKGGTDQLPKSIGIGGQTGDINSPTVLNVAFNFKQFWDGRAETLEEQVDGPIQNPKEMGSNWPEVIAKLKQSPEYVNDFAAAYPDGIRSQNIKDAISVFERSLVTPNSRFDRFLRGEQGVLSANEQNGYRLFKEHGCSSCHQGTNIGGNLFEKFGVMTTRKGGNSAKADLGRFNVTGLEADKHVFKVPSLRNIALTAPYFHDGSSRTLEEAVNVMAVFQLGRSLTPSDTQDIVKFLNTLTGDYKPNSR